MFDVEEVDNGFNSNDKLLQEIIESYWYIKNKRELRELVDAQREENEAMYPTW